ncbi:ABC transporter permease subunit [uncultured Arthrobacter sp.]|uniref:ABC transporter permease subunit n=1 Tax=uncultured Arthrobacter sp. TaxID=114050 RepID=UPI0026382329|nr:ABC transporter permease subunit [uncultured Arthrobacter sp.]
MTAVVTRARVARRRVVMPGARRGAAVHAGVGALLVVWILAPLLPSALWSVAHTWQAPAVLPGSYSGAAFTVLLQPGTLGAALTSLLLGGCVALVATPLGLLGALAARALPGRRGRAVDLILLAPLAIPPFALVMGVNITLLRLHVPAFAGVALILVVTALPYTSFMFRSALTAYEGRFDDVARTLGAAPPQVLRYVRSPLLAAATTRAFFLAFLVGWGDYITTLLAGGGRLSTLPTLLGAAASSPGSEQLTAVLSLGVIVPPLVVLAALALPTVTGPLSRGVRP